MFHDKVKKVLDKNIFITWEMISWATNNKNNDNNIFIYSPISQRVHPIETTCT